MTIESLTLIQQGNSISIQNDDDYRAACEFLKGATQLIRQIVEHYEPLKKAAFQLHKALCAAQDTQTKPVDVVIERVKGEIIAWDQLQQQKARALQSLQQDAANREGGNSAPQLQVTHETPKVDGISGRSTWTCVVDDASKLPAEYLMPDMVKLNQAAKRMKELFNVPGARAIQDRNVIVRT